MGLDSLDLLEVSFVIQQRYGVKLKADDLQNATIFASLNNLAEHVSTALATLCAHADGSMR